jgi:YYY domain-containing protein
VASLLAWGVYPAIYRATPGLRDRGISLVRPLGLLFSVLAPWWLSAIGILPFSDPVIVGCFLALGVTIWTIEFRRRELIAFIRDNRRTVLAFEVVALALFLSYILFRGFNPAIAFTEKPMDFAFLTSAIQAQVMPPPDPWFAGQPINYYYLGYVLIAVIARLSRIEPAVAYNLGLATLFSSSAIAAAGTAANIARAWPGATRARTVASGLLGGLLLTGAGNLVTLVEILRSPRLTLTQTWFEGVGWGASRVITDSGIPGSSTPHPTINEFPAFSFILGDLHPHLLAYPLFLSAIGLAYGIAALTPGPSPNSGRGGNTNQRAPLSQTLGEGLGVRASVFAGTLVGALYAVNAWDMPTALLVMAGAIIVARSRIDWHTAFSLGALGVSALITLLPFALHYTAPVGADSGWTTDRPVAIPGMDFIIRTLGLVVWPKSSLRDLLLIYGLFLLIFLFFALCLWWSIPIDRRRPPATLLVLAPLFLITALATHFAALAIFGLPLLALLWLARNGKDEHAPRFTTWLFFVAFFLILAVEVVFLRDVFGDRMNTVFKVYFQVWGVLAIAAAVAIPAALAAIAARLGKGPVIAVGAFVALLIIGAGLYTPISAYHWDDGFATWHGLDGLAYITQIAPAEREAIDWLRTNAQPGDVVLEAPGCSYGTSNGLPDSRGSRAPGVPTVSGWPSHEFQWRAGQPDLLQEITERQQAVNQIYDDPESDAAGKAIDWYHVTYMYIGVLETRGSGSECDGSAPYPSISSETLKRRGWTQVFQTGDVRVFYHPAAGA